MLSRHLKKIDQGDKTLYRVVLESDECYLNTPECRFIQFELLRYIAEDPATTACGFNDFRKLTMWHDGTKWIVEAEAIVKS